MSKLGPKSLKCIFLGYSCTKKGYKCFSPYPNQLIVCVDVVFFESQSYFLVKRASNSCDSHAFDDEFMYYLVPTDD